MKYISKYPAAQIDDILTGAEGLSGEGTAGQVLTRVNDETTETEWRTPAAADVFYFDGEIINTAWEGEEAPYTQAVTVMGMTSDMRPVLDAVVASPEMGVIEGILKNWSKILYAETGTDEITFYSSDDDTFVDFHGWCVK